MQNQALDPSNPIRLNPITLQTLETLTAMNIPAPEKLVESSCANCCNNIRTFAIYFFAALVAGGLTGGAAFALFGGSIAVSIIVGVGFAALTDVILKIADMIREAPLNEKIRLFQDQQESYLEYRLNQDTFYLRTFEAALKSKPANNPAPETPSPAGRPQPKNAYDELADSIVVNAQKLMKYREALGMRTLEEEAIHLKAQAAAAAASQ